MAQRAVGECRQCEARASLTLFVNKIMKITIEGHNMIDQPPPTKAGGLSLI